MLSRMEHGKSSITSGPGSNPTGRGILSTVHGVPLYTAFHNRPLI